MNTLKESFRLNELISLSFSRILLAGMMVCTAISFESVFRFFVARWQSGYLPWICLLVSLEAILMYDRLRRTADLDHSRLYYRVMEWVVILVVIKVIMYIGSGFALFLQEVPNYAINFFESFFSTGYLLVSLASLLCWGLMTWNLSDLQEIEGDVALVDASTLDGYFSNRGQVRRRLGGRFLAIGFGMLLINAVTAIDYQALFAGRFNLSSRGGTLNLVIYFMLGFLFLSQTHFSVLRASWAWDRIPIEPHMAKRWLVYSLIALGIVSLIAFLLPTQYSLGLLSTLSFVISILTSLAYVILFLISAPLLFLMGLLSRLLNLGQGLPDSLPPPTMPEPPVEMASPGMPPWVKILQSVLFWAIFLTIIGYAFVQYIRQNKELAARLKNLRGFRLLVQVWKWLRGRVGRLNQAVSAVVGAGVQRLRTLFRRSEASGLWQIINPRRLTPRLQVLFYYLALVRRGSEAGLPRKPDQTPYEYARTLSRNLPDVGEDVQAMSEAFVEARYSQHLVDKEQSSRVSQLWARLRQVLRSSKHR